MALHERFPDEPTGLVDDVKAQRSGPGNWRNLLPDPVAMWIIFRRHLVLFTIIFLGVIVAAALWAITRQPVYEAEASLLVRPPADVLAAVKSVTPDLAADSDIVNTKVALIQSPTLAARVASRYAHDHPDSELVKSVSPTQLPNKISSMIDISRNASTYVINADARSTDPQQAADIANLFVSEFVAADKESKVDVNASASSWLKQRTTQLEADAQKADAALQAYRIRNGLLSDIGTNGLTEGGGGGLAQQEVTTMDQQIAEAQAELAQKQGLLKSAREQLAKGSAGADVGAALGSGTISTLRQRESETASLLADLQSRFGPDYPDVARTSAQLKSIRAAIQSEINRILSDLQAQANASSSRLASLQASRSHSEGVLAQNNAAQVGYQELQRRATAAKTIYETVLARQHETSAQEGLERADTEVNSLAPIPEEPVFPNRRLTGIFAVIGGLFAGFLGIGVAEYTQRGLKTKSDVMERLGLHYVGAVPTLGSTLTGAKTDERPHEYVVSHPQSAFAEAFRSLTAYMLFSGRGSAKGARVIAISSALPQEGKSTIAVCMARLAAMGGMSTLLIDCDQRRAGVSELTGYTLEAGLADVLAGGPVDAALQHDPATGLVVLGSGRQGSTGSAGISQFAIERLLAEVRPRFQLVILDTAPVLAVADSRIVGASADYVLLVARWGKTSLQAVKTATEQLESLGARIAGSALSQVDIRKFSSTGYGDTYNYHKNFKGYYTD